MATAMAMKKGSQYWGMMDRKPGRPPTPTEKAMTPLPTEMVAAMAEPIMPQMKGKPAFRLTPNSAGSVTPM